MADWCVHNVQEAGRKAQIPISTEPGLNYTPPASTTIPHHRIESKITMKVSFIIVFTCAVAAPASAGPIAWGLCQTACNAGFGTCLGGFGLIAGTLFGTSFGCAVRITLYNLTFSGIVFAPALGAVAAGCSLAQGTCMVACTPLLLAPTP